MKKICICWFLIGAPLVGRGDEIPAEPKGVDPEKAKERIVQDAQTAARRLSEKDSGDQTQRIQQEILANIDALIRKAKQPPMANGGSSSSSGGQSNQSQSSSSQAPMGSGAGDMGGGARPTPQGQRDVPGQSAGAQARKERRKERSVREAARSQLAPLAGGNPRQQPKGGNGGLSDLPVANSELKETAMPRLPDVYKDVWGHLPEKMRQEMDLYFREQFMPRYSDLLRQYYSSLAERGGKANP